MDAIDLQRLTDFDFENLCKDIFEEVLGRRLEIFSPGSDGGIDLRCWSGQFGNLIIQCKHYPLSSGSRLISTYKAEELGKVEKLAPQRYIIATSAKLSPDSKGKLVEILTPYLQGVDDIWGLHEIAGFLRSNPILVTRHMRLWLNSATVLSALLNTRLLARSGMLKEDIDASLLTYVPGRAHERAAKILESEHACVITGLPGVGKTTLAYALVAKYLADGYTVYETNGQIDEVHATWLSSEKQVYLIDDFLGQTALDGSRAASASTAIKRLVRAVKTNPDKRLIFTSRNYLVEHAAQVYETLRYLDLDATKCMVDVQEYSFSERALILYNHLYFSTDTPGGVQSVSIARVLEVIDHANYSPRLLEHAIVQHKRMALSGESLDLYAEILRNLDHPKRLWETLVQDILAPDEVALIYVLYSADRVIRVSDLREIWRSFLGRDDDSDSRRMLDRILRKLQSTVVKVESGSEDPVVAFHNPSVRDYIEHRLRAEPDIVCRLLERAVFFVQIITLWDARLADKPHKASQIYRSFGEAATRCVAVARSFNGAELMESYRIRYAIEISKCCPSEGLYAAIHEVLMQLDKWEQCTPASELAATWSELGDIDVPNREEIRARIHKATIMQIADADGLDWYDLRDIGQAVYILGEHLDREVEAAFVRAKLDVALSMLDEWEMELPSHFDIADLEEAFDCLYEHGVVGESMDKLGEYFNEDRRRSIHATAYAESRSRHPSLSATILTSDRHETVRKMFSSILDDDLPNA